MAMRLAKQVTVIEQRGFTVRDIGSGKDGVHLWAVHVPDPTTGTGYNPRSYFDQEGLITLSEIENRQDLRVAIAAAQKLSNKYINIREDETMKTTATTERKAREAKTKKAPAKAGKGTTKKAVKKASSNGHVPGKDPVVDMLATYQDQTIERMTGNAVVTLFKSIAKATRAKPVVNASLSVYPQRIARALATMGLINKEKIDGIGLAFFANPNAKAAK